MKETIAKVITIIICPFLAYGFGVTLYKNISFAVVPGSAVAFLVGFVGFAILWRQFRRHFQMICTFEHEVTHLIFGLLFLKMPHSFVATRHDGGYVEMSGGNFVITLAPYFFPTISYFLLPLVFLVSTNYHWMVFGILGASTAFHIVSTWADLHWEQSDLHKAGIPFSVAFLLVANLVFHGGMQALVFYGANGFLAYWREGTMESLRLPLRLFV